MAPTFNSENIGGAGNYDAPPSDSLLGDCEVSPQIAQLKLLPMNDQIRGAADYHQGQVSQSGRGRGGGGSSWGGQGLEVKLAKVLGVGKRVCWDVGRAFSFEGRCHMTQAFYSLSQYRCLTSLCVGRKHFR